MRTYPDWTRAPTRTRWLRAGLALLVAGTPPAAAQQRRYLIEVSAAGGYQSFDDVTDLGSAAGGLGRIGLWLPLNFSLEAEGSFATPKTQTADVGVNVRTISGALLYNVLLGSSSSLYFKAGGGSTKYGGTCAPRTICGTSGALIGGAGFRAGLTPTVMLRGEGQVNRNKSSQSGATSVTLSNFGASLGLSLMLGSHPIPDGDGDGILDNRDRCPGTPAGAQVDGRGCPSDGDGDGVLNGIDRCPNTIPNAKVDPTGCTIDSDSDNIPDGLDRCPDTPAGVLVDPDGCAKDSDGDSIPDGLDRCSSTPRGATVDALGCPGDEDGDGVLDGLDQCPRTSAGAIVNAPGCSAEQAAGQPSAAPAPAPPAPAPAPDSGAQARKAPARRQPLTPVPTPAPAPAPAPPQPEPRVSGTIVAGVLPGVRFIPGTARLQPESYVALDSLASLLLSNRSVRIEVGAHTDNVGSGAENLRQTTLQAEAVRDYLIVKGVTYDRVLPHGYGATVPLTPDTTPRGRAANRRIEIRPVTTGP